MNTLCNSKPPVGVQKEESCSELRDEFPRITAQTCGYQQNDGGPKKVMCCILQLHVQPCYHVLLFVLDWHENANGWSEWSF